MIQVTFIFLIPYITVTIEFPLPTHIQGQFHLAISLFPQAFARVQTNLIWGDGGNRQWSIGPPVGG